MPIAAINGRQNSTEVRVKSSSPAGVVVRAFS